MGWIKTKDRQPEVGQECLVVYKHGVMDAQYVGKDDCGQDHIFFSYIWHDHEFFGQLWMPIEEAKEKLNLKEL